MTFTNTILAGFVLLAVSLIIALSVLNYVRPSTTYSMEPPRGKLNKNTTIGSVDEVRDNFIKPGNSTLMFYVYLYPNQRTSYLMNDITTPGNTLASIGSAFRLSVVPGNANSSETALLTIATRKQPSTENANDTVRMENIEIPRIPIQKWVLITIVKEARRFTVYYNDKVVASQRTEGFPIVSSTNLTIGNRGFLGEFGLPNVSATAYRLEDVQQYLRDTSDTRDKPVLPNEESIWDVFSLFSCPSGLFCFSTDGFPASRPLQYLSSPY